MSENNALPRVAVKALLITDLVDSTRLREVLGSTSGTLMYLAPEVLEGTAPSVATEAYSFGVTLLQAASGQPKMAVSDKWRRAVRNAPTRKLIAKLLRGDAAKRLQDFHRIADALAGLKRKTIRRRIVQAAALLPVGARVRLVKHPTSHDGQLAFELLTTYALEILSKAPDATATNSP